MRDGYPNELHELAAACVLQMANSKEPGQVLAQHFAMAFALGVQAGLRKTTDSLDAMAQEERE